MSQYDSFYNLCLYESNINVIENFYFKNKININIHQENNKLFKKLCILNIHQDLFNVIKFLYEQTNYEDWIFSIEHLDDIFTHEDIICFLSRKGYLQIAKYIYNKDKSKINLYQKNNEPIILACQENHIEFIKWLYELEPTMDIFKDNIIIENSCYYKKNEIIEWYSDKLLKSTKSDIFIKDGLKFILNYISNNNTLNIFVNILQLYISKYNIDDIIIKCFKSSILNNNKDILIYLLNNYEYDQNIAEYLYFECPVYGNVDILKLIDNKYDFSLINTKELFIMSLSNNNLELCNYIYNNKCINTPENSLLNICNLFDLSLDVILEFICRKDVKVTTFDYIITLLEETNILVSDATKNKMINILCVKNNLECAKFIYNKLENKVLEIEHIDLPYYQTLSIFIKKILRLNNIDLTKWILEKLQITKKTLINKYIGKHTLNIIILSKDTPENKINFIKWLFSKSINKYINQKTFLYSIYSNSLELITFIYNQKKIKLNNNILENICINCDINILKWHLNNTCLYTKTNVFTCFEYACYNTKYDIAYYIYNRYNIDLNKKNFINIFKKICLPENIRIILWLYSLKPPNIHIYLDKEWTQLCQQGCFQLIRWILNNQNIIHINLWQGFKKALLYGKLDIVELLLEYQPNLLSMLISNDEVFESIIIYGKNNILEWLTEKNISINLDKYININTIYDICYKQYINTLKWIMKKTDITPIIRYKNDIIFKDMCELYNIIIIRYLIDTYDCYTFKMDGDNVIPIIKDTPEYYFENKEFDKLLEIYNIQHTSNISEFTHNACMICYNDSQIKTECDHFYCMTCIFKWHIYKSQKCPYCRQTINLENCNYIKLI